MNIAQMSSVVLDPTERGPAQLASRVDPMDWFVLRQTALVPSMTLPIPRASRWLNTASAKNRWQAWWARCASVAPSRTGGDRPGGQVQHHPLYCLAIVFLVVGSVVLVEVEVFE